MSVCKYCGDDVDPKKMGRHVIMCEHNPKYSEYVAKRAATNKTKCAKHIVNIVSYCKSCRNQFTTESIDGKQKSYFCSRSCANRRNMSVETRSKIQNSNRARIKHRKTNYCLNCASSCKNKFCNSECRSSYGISDETKLKISNAVKGKTGGFRNFGGSGKKGIYKNILYQSSWELAWLIFQFEHGLNPTRIDFWISYVNENGRSSKYYPDFMMDNTIFEVKGFMSKKTELKIAAARLNGYNIRVISKDEIYEYIDYCVEKYGKEFWNSASLV